MSSSSSRRDSSNMRGVLLSKNDAVPLAFSRCHRRSSPSNMSAAIRATKRPLKSLPASLKPVSYLHIQRSNKNGPISAENVLIYSSDGFQVQFVQRVVYWLIQRTQIHRRRHAMLNHGNHRRNRAPANVPLQRLCVFVRPQYQITVKVKRRLEPALGAQAL